MKVWKLSNYITGVLSLCNHFGKCFVTPCNIGHERDLQPNLISGYRPQETSRCVHKNIPSKIPTDLGFSCPNWKEIWSNSFNAIFHSCVNNEYLTVCGSVSRSLKQCWAEEKQIREECIILLPGINIRATLKYLSFMVTYVFKHKETHANGAGTCGTAPEECMSSRITEMFSKVLMWGLALNQVTVHIFQPIVCYPSGCANIFKYLKHIHIYTHMYVYYVYTK